MPADVSDQWEKEWKGPPETGLPPEGVLLGAVHVLDDVGPIRRSRQQPIDTALLLCIPVTVLVGLVVLPVARTVWRAVANNRWGIGDIAAAGWRTVIWAVIVPFVITAVGLVLADILRVLSGRVMFLLIAPLAVPLVVTGIAFRLLLHPDPDRGLATRYLAFIVGDQGWLGPRWITLALCMAFIWAWLGLATVIFRTALDRMRGILIRRTREQGRLSAYPAEIEAAIVRHEAVDACAVEVSDNGSEVTCALIELADKDKPHQAIAPALREYLNGIGGRVASFQPGSYEPVDKLLRPGDTSSARTPRQPRMPRIWEVTAFFRRYWSAGLGWVAVIVFLLTAVMTSRTLALILTMSPGSTVGDASVLSVLHWQARETATPGRQEALGTLWLLVILALVVICFLPLRFAHWERPRWPHLRLHQPRNEESEEDGNVLRMIWRALHRAATLPWRSLKRLGDPSHAKRSAVYMALSLVWLFPLIVLLMTSWHSRTEAATRAWWIEPSWFGFGSWSFDDATREAMFRTVVIASATAVTVVVLASFVAKALEGMSSLGEHLVIVLIIGLALVPPQVVGVQVNEVFAWGPLTGIPPWQRLILVHVALAVPLATILFYATRTDWLGAMWDDLQRRWSEIDRKGSTKVGGKDSSGWRSVQKVWVAASTPWKTMRAEQPTVLAVAVLVSIQVWNDFVIGVLVGQDAIPLTVHLFGQTRQFVSNSGPLAAASVIAAIVPLTLLLFTGSKLIEGLVGRDRHP